MIQKSSFSNGKREPTVGKGKEFVQGRTEEKKRYIENLELHLKSCKEAIDYSISRFDILIISLSSGALVFSMSFIKDIAGTNATQNISLLKISWGLFGSSLILNLLSQVTSYYANKYEIKITKRIIQKQRGKVTSSEESNLDAVKSVLNSFTLYFNSISLFALISGIIILIIFTSYNF